MDHFYTQQKGRRPSIIKDQKNKKLSVHSYMCLTTVDVCVRLCLCIRTYAARMWASWHVWVYACFCFLDIFMRLNWSYFLFGLSVTFSVNSILVKISKLNKERERERERKREKERERWRERERERESAGWGGWEEEGQRGRRKMVKKNSRTYLLAPVVFTPNAYDFQVWRLALESWKFAVIHWPWHATLRYLAELTSLLRQTYDQTQVAFECCS